MHLVITLLSIDTSGLLLGQITSSAF